MQLSQVTNFAPSGGPLPEDTFDRRDDMYPGYAHGGVAAAKQTQSKGRGQDTMLVHMTPGEVKGLQALAMAHGGSLTINPHTGLPEAGFLSSILPMVAGVALTAATGLPAWQIGLLAGGATTLATGSLKKGLMAGLGAYGGAGVGQGLIGAGGIESAGSAANMASAAPTSAPTPTPGPYASDMYSRYADIEGARNLQAPSMYAADGYSKFAEAPGAVKLPYTPSEGYAPQVPYNQATTPTGDSFSRMGKGFENLVTGQEGSTKAFMEGMKEVPYSSAAGLASTALGATGVKPYKAPESNAHIRPYEFSWNKDEGAFTPSPTPGDTSERRYVNPTYTALPIYKAASGGLTALAEGGVAKKPKPTRMGANPFYHFADSRRDSSMGAAIEQNFASGGMKDALPPRFLSGGGDGMSDSIKANIDGKQEARLADGEFVVPADVVSHLGNGSSKAGAKKLYAMMDKIRKARTGKTNQAPEVDAKRYMPA